MKRESKRLYSACKASALSTIPEKHSSNVGKFLEYLYIILPTEEHMAATCSIALCGCHLQQQLLSLPKPVRGAFSPIKKRNNIVPKR
jgi:hypothetical protein